MDIRQYMDYCMETKNLNEDEGIYLLKCLCMSLSDEEGKLLVKRHTILMSNYLDLRQEGIKSADLPYLMSPLEFFSENSADECLYSTLFLKSMKLLLKPILLLKSSDACFAKDNLMDFFSALGNCLLVATDTKIESTILDVILFLITSKEKKSEEVTLEIRMEAVEDSVLPEIIVSIMFLITDELYHPLLEIMYQLSLQPCLANLFHSMGCMDFWIRKVAIKNNLSIREGLVKETTNNLLWSILRSPDKFGDEPTLNSQSLSVLRGWLRREILYGKTYERNNIASLILQTLISIPKLEISRSGILEDVGLLAVATEFGTSNTWASKINFKPTRDDLDFKKIMITILLIKNEEPITKMVLLENRTINALAYLLNLRYCKEAFHWDQNQKVELMNCCLYALPKFSKHFKQEYTCSGATRRILEIIDYFTCKQQNLRLVKNCCLCLHLLISMGISHKHFRVLNVTQVLIRIIFHSLDNLQLNLMVQSIVTYCFCAITNLVQDDNKSKEILAQDLAVLYSRIFNRVQKPIKTDTKISMTLQSAFEFLPVDEQHFTVIDNVMNIIHTGLLISVCDFVWQCVVLNENTKDFFFESLGVHAIFNIIEEAPFVVQVQFLSLLSDLCVDPQSLPQIVTWRGKDRNNNFFTVLCDLWRKQEKMKGVLRDKYGCIEDIEHALMGEQQKIGTKSENADTSASPALVDLIGCARPKIAVAIDLITRRHFEKVKLACSVYSVPFDTAISPDDEITLKIIQCYEELKQGEVLWEVQRAVDKVGVKLLPLDVEVLHQLIMRLIGLASKIQNSQRTIIKAMRKKELDEEHKIYKEIEEYKLANAIKELLDRDYYMTVSNAIYRKWKHQKYEEFLNNIEQLYADKRDQNYHQTFNHPRNFIVVKTGRDAHIISIKRKKESSRISFYDEIVPDETNSEEEQ